MNPSLLNPEKGVEREAEQFTISQLTLNPEKGVERSACRRGGRPSEARMNPEKGVESSSEPESHEEEIRIPKRELKGNHVMDYFTGQAGQNPEKGVESYRPPEG